MNPLERMSGKPQYELLRSDNKVNNHVDEIEKAQNTSLGTPKSSRSLSTSDYILTLSCLIFSLLALMTVFEPNVAVKLGQVNQLIALGLLLALMTLCTQSHIQQFLLLSECLWHRSSLQNFDAIIRTSVLVPNTSWLLRILIALYFLFPLGLGIAYKNFTGGSMASRSVSDIGTYGITGPPGTVAIGAQGIALFMNATLPWWTNPVSDGAFGFNLNVDSAGQTAMLDAPTPEYVSDLRSKLRPGGSMLLNTVVNATVAEMVVNIADPTLNADLAFWYGNNTINTTSPRQATDDLWDWFNSIVSPSDHPTVYSDNVFRTVGSGLMIPRNPDSSLWNSSFIMTSRWNSSMGESFGSVAQGFHVYRHRYRAVWSITGSSVSLDSAERMPDGPLTDSANRNLIEHNWLQIETYFPSVVAEYDWKYIGNSGAYVRNPSLATTIQHQHVKTDATIVAAMVWSRLASWNGLENPFYKVQVQEGVAAPGVEYSSGSTYQLRTETLKASPLLALVLIVNPAALLVLLAIRMTLLRNAPISEDFGVISLLAALDGDSKRLLKGASYSGRLGSDVRIRFVVSNPDSALDEKSDENLASNTRGEIVVKLERVGSADDTGRGRTARIRRDVVYE